MCMQVSQKGLIGITLVANWYLPFSATKSDQKATERAIDFMFGWYGFFIIPTFSIHFNLSTKYIFIHCFKTPKNNMC